MKPHSQEQVTFWKMMADGLSTGTPLIDCLREARRATTDTTWREVVDKIIAAVQGGKTLSAALAEQGEVFDPQIVSAMERGEVGKVPNRVAGQILESLKAGDLTLLGDGAAAIAPQAVEYISSLLDQAEKSGASDIHIDPTPDGRGIVRLRIDGVLHEVDPPAKGLLPKVIDYVKTICAMNVAERRLPQDGRCYSDKGGGQERCLFANVTPVHYGQRTVIRLIKRAKVELLLSLDKVGLGDKDLQTVRGLCGLPAGIVIINGPAGSGKTTVLYSMLREINSPEICVMTVEDPVELAFERVGQMQINPQIGLTFPRAIRNILRQDPDVVLVGEIRDLETLHVCNQVALSGHLVLTTLHANTSPGAIRRVLDMGLEPFLVNSSVAAVISMRLVRMLCPKCRQPSEPQLACLPPEAVQFVAGHKEATFFVPKGCSECSGRGYKGRTGLYEILVMNDRLRQQITDGAELAVFRSAAQQEGMKPMLIDGLEKAAAGVTSIEEVLRVVPTTN